MKIINKLFISAFILLCSISAQATEFREVMNYQQFQILLQEKVSQIPDLSAPWRDRATNSNLQHVYIGGGIIRGLIRFLYLELQKTPLEQVWSVKVPSISKLIVEKADQDVFVPTNLYSYFENHYFNGWDILPWDGFMADSEIVGGITFEKVGINPTSVLDRTGGLLAYYQGRYEFKANETYIHGPFTEGKVLSDYYLALALRFIRISTAIPGATPTDESIATIKRLVAQEAPYIQRNVYWIKKALWKLYLEIGDIGRVLLLLKEYEVLNILSEKGYFIETFTDISQFEKAVPQLIAAGFTTEDFRSFFSMQFSGNEEFLKKAKTAVLVHAKTAPEFLSILRYTNNQATNAERKAASTAAASSSSAFLNTHPNIDEILEFMGFGMDPAFVIAYRKAVLNKVGLNSFDDFMRFTYLEPGNRDDTVLTAMGQFVSEHVDFIVSLKPTASQWTKLILERSHKLQFAEVLLRKAISQVTTATEYLTLTEYPYPKATFAAKNLFLKILAETKPVFLALHPTANEIEQFENRLNIQAQFDLLTLTTEPENAVTILEALIPKFAIASDFMHALQLATNNKNDKFKGKFDTLLVNNVSLFAALNPTVEVWRDYLSKVYLVSNRTIILKAAIAHVKAASDYIQVTQFGKDFSTELKKEIREIVINSISSFFKLHPTVAEIKILEKRSNNLVEIKKILEEALKYVSSAEDMLLLVQSAFERPSKEYNKLLSEAALQHNDKFLSYNPSEELLKQWGKIIFNFPFAYTTTLISKIQSGAPFTIEWLIQVLVAPNHLGYPLEGIVFEREIVWYLREIRKALTTKYEWTQLYEVVTKQKSREMIVADELSNGTDAKDVWDKLQLVVARKSLPSSYLTDSAPTIWFYFKDKTRTYEDFLLFSEHPALPSNIRQEASDAAIRLAENLEQLKRVRFGSKGKWLTKRTKLLIRNSAHTCAQVLVGLVSKKETP